MKVSLSWMVRKASWSLVWLSLAALFGYSYWAFTVDASWTNALSAAGGSLPETSPGFHSDEPERSFALLRGAGLVGVYVRFQAIDIPFAIFNALFMWSVLVLAVKRFAGANSLFRYVTILPCLYLLAEFVEDALLVLLANGQIGAPASLVFMQQVATSAKWASMAPAFLIVLAALLALFIATATTAMRRPKT